MLKSLPKIERILWMSFTAVLLFAALFLTRKQQLEQVKSRFLQDDELSDLKRKGLKRPVSDLVADLQKHKELIPHEGVLGGTMGFYGEDDVHILSRNWVVADFDDGHILGKALLEYKVPQQGKISWKVIDSYVDD